MMHWVKQITLALSTLCLTLSASSQEEYSRDPAFPWSRGNKHFATGFYPQARKSGHNFVFSPISLQLGLAMTAELAEGQTQQEILDVMVLPTDQEVRREGAERIISALNNESSRASLAIANGTWLSSDIIPTHDFDSILSTFYQSEMYQADFINFAENSRQEINHWVEENTAGQIQNFMQPGSVNTDTRLVLVNTLYMKSSWKHPFDPRNSYEGSFYGLEKSLRPILYMRQTASFGFLEEANYSVIQLPFTDSLSLIIVLPNLGVPLQEIEDTMTTRRLAHWMEDCSPTFMALSLPKFKVASQLNTKDMLQNMGMRVPFIPGQAEFDLDNLTGRIAITDIFHNAVFEVDEEGGAGSAATGVVIGITSWIIPPPQQVLVNRPFLFFVVDGANGGTVLFSGRIMQPRTE